MSGDGKKEDPVTVTATHLRAVPGRGEMPKAATKVGAVELEALFREHYDRVFRTAYRITGSASDAEDVLQTVFLRLVRRESLPEFSPSAAAYLTRAAINAALDIIRARTSAQAVALDEVEPAELVASPRQSPEALHEDRELRRLIQKSLGSVSRNAAEMFVLRYFEGFDNHEIAQLMGTSHLVVGVLLHRTRTRLRKEIGEYLEAYHEA